MKEVLEEYSDREREFIEEEKDPSYSPEAEEQEEEDEDVVPPSPEAAPTASKKKSQKFTGREKNVVAPPTETAQSASTRKRKATSAGEDEPNVKSRKRSHHAKRMCPVCKQEDANLKRHLLSHAKKGHIKTESVASILSIAINEGRRRGPARSTSTSTGTQQRKGLKLKWCPVKDCQKVTHLLRSHLSKFHNIKAAF